MEEERKVKHLKLASMIKGVHAQLRKQYQQASGDYEKVWADHCRDRALLTQYADAMHHLATEIWSKNPETRIDWCHSLCQEYFLQGGLEKVLEKETRRKRYRKESKASDGEGEVSANDDDDEDMVEASTPTSPDCCVKWKSEEYLFRPNERVETDPPGCCYSRSCDNDVVADMNSHALRLLAHPPSTVSELANRGSASCDLTYQLLDATSEEASQLSDGFLQVPQRRPGSASTRSEGKDACGCQQGDSRRQYCSSDGVADNPELVLFETGESLTSKHSLSGACSESDLMFGLPDGIHGDRDKALYTKYSQRTYNTIKLPFQGKIRLLDVGSCFNPFLQFDEFVAVGIDISPAVPSVFDCDFLHLELVEPLQLASDTVSAYLHNLHSPVEWLPRQTFHVLVFSLLLEYLPSAYQRWLCCQKAHDLLMLNGLLVVITPDSHQQHRNAPMIKSWKRAIESLGFTRWRYVKQEHLHCMAFRKRQLHKDRASSELVGDVGPDMLYIPQDSHPVVESDSTFFFGSLPRSDEENALLREAFSELPEMDLVP